MKRFEIIDFSSILKQNYESQEAFDADMSLIKRGDIIGVAGRPTRSKRGGI